ncbi:hypothetical protein ACFSO7_02200 [Bacillus sp. CGMCC 1.16607]|uniref:hypothetical protein n=1 Tax=Bacillus sp. CGMCC 1.16607 TaxID=3351842 RepID=UPI0036279451
MSKLKITVMAAVAVSAISIGSGMANQDAGGKLQSWYDNLLGQTQQSATAELNSYSKSLVPGIEAEKNELITDTNTRITTLASSEVNRKIGRIQNYNGIYLGQVWDKQEQLIGGQVEKDFDSYIQTKNVEVNAYITNQANSFLSEVENELDGKVSETVTGIESKKQSAVDTLNTTIELTQTNLNKQLSNEQQTATEEMKKNLDQQIDVKKEEVEAAVKNAETNQKEAIATKGENIENAALKDLQQMVNNNIKN